MHYIFTFIIVVFILYIFSRSVALPLIYLARMKLRYGKKVKCYYIPVLGITLLVYLGIVNHGDPFAKFKILRKKHPEIEAIAVGGYYCNEFIIMCPKLVKEFMINKMDKFTKVDDIFYVDLILEQGLLFTDGEVWKRQRKLMSPHFNFE